MELAGLPSVPSAEGLEGTSLAPVLNDPHDAAGVKAFAYSQYPRCPQYDILTDSIRCESRPSFLCSPSSRWRAAVCSCCGGCRGVPADPKREHHSDGLLRPIRQCVALSCPCVLAGLRCGR